MKLELPYYNSIRAVGQNAKASTHSLEGRHLANEVIAEAFAIPRKA